MHSRIFQITTEQVERKNYLNENTLEQGDGSPINCCSEIDDDEREQNIACLVGAILPKGMFTRVGTNIIRYNGGMEQWKAETVAMIQEKAAALTADNFFRYSAHRNLEQALVNPLGTAYLFYTDTEGLQGYADQSYYFMLFVGGLEEGTLLHIGGVIDYHF